MLEGSSESHLECQLHRVAAVLESCSNSPPSLQKQNGHYCRESLEGVCYHYDITQPIMTNSPRKNFCWSYFYPARLVIESSGLAAFTSIRGNTSSLCKSSIFNRTFVSFILVYEDVCEPSPTFPANHISCCYQPLTASIPGPRDTEFLASSHHVLSPASHVLFLPPKLLFQSHILRRGY